MSTHRIYFLLAALVFAGPAAAQDAGRRGVMLEVPAALGFIWHATDRVALRPEVNLSTSKTSSNSGTSGFTADGLTWGVAISAPYYMTNRDNVRTYVSPRVSYARSTTDAGIPGATLKSTATQLVYSGSFGAQYAPIRRFNVFGETGYSFSSIKNTSTALSSTSTTSGWSVRSAVGVILYFEH